MLLQHQTWQEVEGYLTQSKGIIIPIGSTEQHGPNGLIGTDAICAEVIARGVGEAANALVLLCHKFARRMARWQHGQRGRVRAMARAMTTRTDVIEVRT